MMTQGSTGRVSMPSGRERLRARGEAGHCSCGQLHSLQWPEKTVQCCHLYSAELCAALQLSRGVGAAEAEQGMGEHAVVPRYIIHHLTQHHTTSHINHLPPLAFEQRLLVSQRTARLSPVGMAAFSSVFLTVFSIVVLLLTSVAASSRIQRNHSRGASPPAVRFSSPGTLSATVPSSSPSSTSPSAQPTWSIDTSQPVHSVHPDLYGIFFEEYSFSGEGGLYQQQIQNINFETTLSTYAPWEPLHSSSSSVHYTLQLDVRQPLNAYNPTSLLVTTKGQAGQQAGVINPGFWGISMINRTAFDVSLHARSASINKVVASLTSADGTMVYGSITFSNITSAWTALRGQIKVSSSDPAARFQLTYQTTADTDRIAFDVVVLMPTQGWNGLQFIRPDLGQLLADLKPSFVRFPGGCYLEGDRLVNRYNWKRALGPLEDRTGHWNFWGHT